MLNIRSIFLAAILITGGITVANAQLTQGSVMKFNAAESFVVMDKTFPAGSYTLERTPSTIDSPTIMILRGEGNAIIFDSITARQGATHSTRLLFNNIEGTLFLNQIQVKGSSVAIALPKSKTEKELIARNKTVTQVVMTSNTGF